MKLLPIRTKLLPNEALSSWIKRLARSNGVEATTILAAVTRLQVTDLPYDFDRFSDRVALKHLALATNNNMQALNGATLAAELGASARARKRDVVRLRGATRIINERAFSYCPICLKEDAIPYLRRDWRFTLFATCPKHGMKLLDQCQRCGELIVTFGNMLSRKPFPVGLCSNCGDELKKHEAVVADCAATKFEASLSDAMSAGVMKVNDSELVPIREYLAGLIAIRRTFLSDRSTYHRGREFMLSRFNIDVGVWEKRRKDGVPDLAARYASAMAFAHLLSNWPNNFVALYREAPIFRFDAGNGKAPSFIRQALLLTGYRRRCTADDKSIDRELRKCIRDGVPPLIGELHVATSFKKPAIAAALRRYRADAGYLLTKRPGHPWCLNDEELRHLQPFLPKAMIAAAQTKYNVDTLDAIVGFGMGLRLSDFDWRPPPQRSYYHRLSILQRSWSIDDLMREINRCRKGTERPLLTMPPTYRTKAGLELQDLLEECLCASPTGASVRQLVQQIGKAAQRKTISLNSACLNYEFVRVRLRGLRDVGLVVSRSVGSTTYWLPIATLLYRHRVVSEIRARTNAARGAQLALSA